MQNRTFSLLLGCALLAACGRADPPDLRSTMSESISRLGMRPIYPLQENRRPGSVVLVDASVAAPDAGLPPWQETSIWLTAELEGPFEAARQRLQQRFPQSPVKLGDSLDPQSGRSFFRQSAVAPADASPPGSLSLAALPGYTLTSVDQTALALAVPNLVASFFASIGLRSTSYLRIEASAVEIAEVPYDEFRAIIAGACNDVTGRTQFSDRGAGGEGVVIAAVDQFEQWRGERVTANERRGWRTALPTTPIEPYIGVLRRVFYLRGIRFITEDSRAAAAFAQVAARQNFPSGSQPVALPAVTVNTAPNPPPPTPAAGTPAATIAAQNAAIAGLQTQIDQLRSGLVGAGSNIQIAASFARATAVGVELEQVFDRPLAFGYQAFFVDARRDPAYRADRNNLNGFANVCRRV